MARWRASRDRRDRVCPGNRVTNTVQREDCGVLPATPATGRWPIRTHVRRPIGPSLRYFAAVLTCSICSNFTSDQVELRRFELLTSCMPSGGRTSTRVHLCRSPSSPVPMRPPLSTRVAVLPCCTAPVPRGGSVPARNEGWTSGNPVYRAPDERRSVHPHSIKQLTRSLCRPSGAPAAPAGIVAAPDSSALR